MYIERNLIGTKEAFFDIITKALIEDVKNCTDRDILESAIKEGFSYSKVIVNKKNHVAKATIKRYNKPNVYKMKISSSAGVTTIEYVIKEISKEEIVVTYKEEFKNKTGKVSNGYFYKRALRKRMNLFFEQIQKYMNT